MQIVSGPPGAELEDARRVAAVPALLDAGAAHGLALSPVPAVVHQVRAVGQDGLGQRVGEGAGGAVVLLDNGDLGGPLDHEQVARLGADALPHGQVGQADRVGDDGAGRDVQVGAVGVEGGVEGREGVVLVGLVATQVLANRRIGDRLGERSESDSRGWVRQLGREVAVDEDDARTVGREGGVGGGREAERGGGDAPGVAVLPVLVAAGRKAQLDEAVARRAAELADPRRLGGPTREGRVAALVAGDHRHAGTRPRPA